MILACNNYCGACQMNFYFHHTCPYTNSLRKCYCKEELSLLLYLFNYLFISGWVYIYFFILYVIIHYYILLLKLSLILLLGRNSSLVLLSYKQSLPLSSAIHFFFKHPYFLDPQDILDSSCICLP